MDEDAIELVGSVGPLDTVVVALREFLHRSGAVRAVAGVGLGLAVPINDATRRIVATLMA